MKSLIAISCLIAFIAAEPPPSNSYLPPSPAGRGQGYPSGGPGGPGALGGPQVIAARNQGPGYQQGANAGFGRAAAGVRPGSLGRGRFGDHGQGIDHDHGYDRNASPFGRNALDDAVDEPASYNFGYVVNDYQEGTDFGHHEERENDRAEGEYHVVLPDGRKQTVSYEADERGFKPRVSYEDSDAGLRGGYDSNANNVGDLNGRLGNGYHGNGHHGTGHHGTGHHDQGYSSGGSKGY